MPATLSDIINIIEKIAPPELAETWDNVGLQIGDQEREVHKVWVALDPLPQVVSAACEQGVDLLVTHHPLIFRPLARIDTGTPLGAIIRQAAASRLAIYSAHTNLDSAAGGLNDLLASRIGLNRIAALSQTEQTDACKLVVFVPPDYEQQFLKALFETPAGSIGAYSCCSFRCSGRGTFRAEAGAKPFSGQIGSISQVDEVRIETVVDRADIQNVVAHLRKHHPYETMAYDVYPLVAREVKPGPGRIGDLEVPMELEAFARNVKALLGLKTIKYAGRANLPVERVAVCSGSGAALLDHFFKSTAAVFVSGDMRYHDARAVESADRGLIDIGHFQSEYIVVEELAQRLRTEMKARKLNVAVEASRMEVDPFCTR